MTRLHDDEFEASTRERVTRLLDAIEIGPVPTRRVAPRHDRFLGWRAVGVAAAVVVLVVAIAVVRANDDDGDVVAVGAPGDCQPRQAATDVETVGRTSTGEPVVLRVRGEPPNVVSGVSVGDRGPGSIIHVASSWYSMITDGMFTAEWASDDRVSVVQAELPPEATVLEVVDNAGQVLRACPIRFGNLPIDHAVVVLADGARPVSASALDGSAAVLLEWSEFPDPGPGQSASAVVDTVDAGLVPLPIAGIALPPYEPTPFDDPALVPPLLTGVIGSESWEFRAFTVDGTIGIAFSSARCSSINSIEPATMGAGEPLSWEAAGVGGGTAVSGPVPEGTFEVRAQLVDGGVRTSVPVAAAGIPFHVFVLELQSGDEAVDIDAVDESGRVLARAIGPNDLLDDISDCVTLTAEQP